MKKKPENILANTSPISRVSISAALAIITYLLVRKQEFNPSILMTLLWDIFALTYVIISWTVFFTSNTEHIKKKALTDDGGKLFVFFIVVFASFISMITVAILVISKDSLGMEEAVYLPIIIGGILLSWTLVHTTFCFHYAHLYYDNVEGTNDNMEGLEFPKPRICNS